MRERLLREEKLYFLIHCPFAGAGEEKGRPKSLLKKGADPISQSGKVYPESERSRPSQREVVEIQCDECKGVWKSDEREHHAVSCLSYRLRRKRFPTSMVEWDPSPEGLLKRVSGTPKSQSVKRARWRRNQSGVKFDKAPRLRESRIS
jgi:hypothetical protein